MYRRWRLWKKSLKHFKEYLDEEAIKEIRNIENKNPMDRLENKTINFLIFQMKDNNIEVNVSLFEKAIKIVQASDGYADIFGSFGLVSSKFDDINKITQLAELLSDLLKEDIKIIYGSVEGAFGNRGTEYCQYYGPIIPGFSSYMNKLINLGYGSIAKV